MSDGDKRSVTTDALATLGMIIGEGEKRDAIHLAVEPVIAGEILYPGTHITVRFGKAYRTERKHALGIVDPFLEETVQRGQRFWFIMYPRQVRSLRHVWSHPAFPDEGAPPDRTLNSKEDSEKWLRDWLSGRDAPSFEDLMAALRGEEIREGYGPCRFDEHGDECYLVMMGTDAHCDIPFEFWHHVEVVTGKAYPRAKHFSCSC